MIIQRAPTLVGLWLSLWLSCALVNAQPLAAVPDKAPVVDLTATLDPGQRAELSALLTALEHAKGSQIGVLIVPTTAPEAAAQYALRVAEQWALGRAGVDDGALLLVAKDDRKLRIEVGYGLEGVIPDITAKRVIDEIIAPAFRQGDFYGGIKAGIERLIGLVEGEPLPAPNWQYSEPGAGLLDGGQLQGLLPLVFVLLPLAPLLGKVLGRLPGAAVAGALAGAIGYLALGLVFGLVLAAFAVIITLRGRVGLGEGQPRARRRPGPYGGVFTDGGRGRGGTARSRPGGFRGGGGGGFGGGGASGSW